MTRNWRKDGWVRLTSESHDKKPWYFYLTKPYRKHDFSWFYYINNVWPLYIAANSKFAPGIAIKLLTAANGHKYWVNFILDDKMLQYCHVFMLPTFKAYTCQQYICVLSAILAANGQARHEYALITAANSLMRLINCYDIVYSENPKVINL